MYDIENLIAGTPVSKEENKCLNLNERLDAITLRD